MASLLYRLWFFAPRFRPSVGEQEVKARARIAYRRIDGRSIASYHWPANSHRRVQLVHGWSGRSTQFAQIITALNHAGYQVYAIDLPAHGLSAGRRTHIFEMAEILTQYAETLGTLEAVVTHSLGGLVAGLALRDQHWPNKWVSIAAPSNMEAVFERYGQMFDIPADVSDRVLTLSKQEFGKNFLQDLSLSNNIKDYPNPGLIIHDCEDRDLPSSEADRLAQHWPNADLLKTRGLGHRRILRDPQLIETMIEFIESTSGARERYPEDYSKSSSPPLVPV